MERAARWSAVAILPLYPLVPRFSLAGPLGTDDLIPVGCCAVLAVALVANRTLPRRRPALVALLLVATVATLPAILTANGAAGAFVAVLRVGGRFGMYAVLFVATLQLLTARDRKRMLTMIAVVAALQGAVGLTAYAFKVQGPWQTGMLHYPPSQMPAHGRARVQGTFGGDVPPGHPFLNRANFYSAYLVMGLMALGAILFDVLDRRRRLLLSLGAAVILGGILVSYSRMSLLAAIAGLGLLTVLHRRWVIATVAAALLITSLGASEPLRQRFLDLGTDRFGQWRIAARVIAGSPALGVGDGRYLEAAGRLARRDEVPLVRTAHNSVLYAAASYGVPAGAALVGLYITLLVVAISGWRRRRSANAAAQVALVGAWVLHDITNNLFFIPEVALTFWAVLAATEVD
ncbi:MAG: O-antigen ligase family protein [Myxococcota bacterium]